MTMSTFQRVLVIVASVLAVSAVVVACGGPDDSENQGAVSDIQEITIEAHDISFTPTNFTVEAGTPVRLTLVNAGALEHDVTIPGMNATDDIVEPADTEGSQHMMSGMAPGTVHLAAHGGESVTVEFTPRAGNFEFYCSVLGHKEAGMTGSAVAH